MYCVKCKYKTDTLNTIQITTTNNKHVIKGICSICGKNKSLFVSNKLLEVEPSVLPPVRPLAGVGPPVPNIIGSGTKGRRRRGAGIKTF